MHLCLDHVGNFADDKLPCYARQRTLRYSISHPKKSDNPPRTGLPSDLVTLSQRRALYLCRHRYEPPLPLRHSVLLLQSQVESHWSCCKWNEKLKENRNGQNTNRIGNKNEFGGKTTAQCMQQRIQSRTSRLFIKYRSPRKMRQNALEDKTYRTTGCDPIQTGPVIRSPTDFSWHTASIVPSHKKDSLNFDNHVRKYVLH